MLSPESKKTQEGRNADPPDSVTEGLWGSSSSPGCNTASTFLLFLLLVTQRWGCKGGDCVVLTYPTAENMGTVACSHPAGVSTALGGLWGH